MTVQVDLRHVASADVYKGDVLAGTLARSGDDVVFSYDDAYRDDPNTDAVAWTIPKTMTQLSASAGSVPPFFAGLLP
ncbi:HipA N-terminal domain-containing protein [Rhodococcoides corynebacterioides]|uniref:HipA N-terminal domain-containing protein n=1 Tax=Rhodococcoides corynebacterioides TaxID=53972 RepID=UPI00352FF1C7